MQPTPNIPAAETQILPLRDIKLPAEPGFWPLAPGWWILLVVVLLIGIFLLIKWYRHQQRKKRWMAINDQLSTLEFEFRKNQDAQQLLSGISLFLRRFVKFQLKQPDATSLNGADWVEHLNQLDSQQTFSPFQTALTQGAFQAHCEYDTDGLLNTTRAFIKRHVMQPKKLETTGV